MDILRDCAQIIGGEDLDERLALGRPLRVKYGADPSAPDLHLGHVVVLRKLRQLQELGHSVHFLIGDFTGMIGDPTGRSLARPPLTAEQIQANARTYQDQVFKVLRPDRTQVVFNSAWCGAMRFEDVIRLAARYTVARILERDDFAARYREGRPIGLHELLYPLIQGYDSVVLKTDIELCGTDQIFNCLVARALQQDAGQSPEIILAMPLLEGLDGVQKMSKSYGNYVGLTDPPQEMFGKLMSLPDGLMGKYFTLLAGLGDTERAQLDDDLAQGRVHPRDAKVRLARLVVEQFHGPAAAEAAAVEFDRVFRDGALPTDMPEFRLAAAELQAGRMPIVRLLLRTGLVSSRKDGQRMVAQGAVEFNQTRITDPGLEVQVEDASVLQIGKRKFVKIIIEQ